jgi:hypothetical protein
MKRTRYLPAGSMRRQRRLGRLEGSVGTLVLVLAIGAAVVAATPVEIYQPAPETVQPRPMSAPSHFAAVPLPACTGQGKDCSTVQEGSDIVRTVPEPGTFALIAAGLAGIAWRRS